MTQFTRNFVPTPTDGIATFTFSLTQFLFIAVITFCCLSLSRCMEINYFESWEQICEHGGPRVETCPERKKILSTTRCMRGTTAGGDGYCVFTDPYIWIHSDEKWFYTTPERRQCRTFPGEKRHLDETAQHKSHIPKMMFVSVLTCAPPSWWNLVWRQDWHLPCDGNLSC